jgi:trigger factor
MKVTKEKIEGSQVVLNVEIEAEEMESAVKQAYRRLGAKTTVPGFRKGKAPPEMLERYYGKEAFVEDAAEHLLPEVYDRAIDEHEVEAIAQPKIDILQINPLSFKATVPVRPTVELADYNEIKIEPETVEVTDEETTEALERLRYMNTPWEPVDRPARFGDLLAINVEGAVEDKVVIDEKEGLYQLEPDPPNAVPGFAEKMEGAEKGEERVFSLTLPEDRGELSGKECNFKVTINEIKDKNLPELDDEFAKSLGQGLETLDSLKGRIGTEIRSRKEWEAKTKLEDQAIEAMTALARTEFPDVLVENEVDRLIDERERYFGDREKLEMYLESIKKTQDELRNELKPMAERNVLRSLVLHKFAELESIEVNDSDVDVEVEQIVGNSTSEGVRQVVDNPSSRETLRRNLYIRKAIDRLMEIATGGQATVATEEVTAEEAVAEEEPAEKEPAESPSKEEGDENDNAAQ